MTDNKNIIKIQNIIRSMYEQLQELNNAIGEAIDDSSIDPMIRLELDLYYHELPSTELLDDIMDCINDYK